MFFSISSASVYGIEAHIIEVEADVSDGLPMFNMVGYLSSEVKEAKDRVRTSLKNSGFILRPKHITVNLSPADLRKAGTAFDLPIALAVLTASEIIPTGFFTDTLVVGELGLEGRVKPITGVLPIVQAACNAGFKQCIVPAENSKEGAVVKGIRVIGVHDLKETVDHILGVKNISAEYVDVDALFSKVRSHSSEDFSDISGQLAARRAAEIAVSGMHNFIMSGPPGAGKTMIARRIPSIMPAMTFEESLEISRIYSIAGKLDKDRFLLTERPFNSPHHTATVPGIVGGGHFASPGAVSLSHNGILFLDELPEFNREVIEALRQPLEDRCVTVSRLNGSYVYPAGFMLVASMNPCPCGYYPDRNRCSCAGKAVEAYRNRISQPILDRIDIFVNVERVEYDDLCKRGEGESSQVIRARVERTRKLQKQRYRELPISFNSELSGSLIDEFCSLEQEEKKFMERAFDKFSLSARGYHRTLKVARTIADMEGSEKITLEHLSEALSYRGNSPVGTDILK